MFRPVAAAVFFFFLTHLCSLLVWRGVLWLDVPGRGPNPSVVNRVLDGETQDSIAASSAAAAPAPARTVDPEVERERERDLQRQREAEEAQRKEADAAQRRRQQEIDAAQARAAEAAAEAARAEQRRLAEAEAQAKMASAAPVAASSASASAAGPALRSARPQTAGRRPPRVKENAQVVSDPKEAVQAVGVMREGDDDSDSDEDEVQAQAGAGSGAAAAGGDGFGTFDVRYASPRAIETWRFAHVNDLVFPCAFPAAQTVATRCLRRQPWGNTPVTF